MENIINKLNAMVSKEFLDEFCDLDDMFINKSSKFYHFTNEENFKFEPNFKYDRRNEKFGLKPSGFWISSDNDWKEWCESESFMLDKITFRYEVGLISPQKLNEYYGENSTHKLLIISPENFDEFTYLFGTGLEKGDENSTIYWNSVRGMCGGILIPSWLFQYRWTRWYYGWDVGSGCIWDPHLISYIVKDEVDTE